MKKLVLLMMVMAQVIVGGAQTIKFKVIDEKSKVVVRNAKVHYEISKRMVPKDTNGVASDSVYVSVDTATSDSGILEVKSEVVNGGSVYLNMMFYKMEHFDELVRMPLPRRDTMIVLYLRKVPMVENFQNRIYFKKNVVTMTDEQKDKYLSGAIALFLMNPDLVFRINSIVNYKVEDLNANLGLQRAQFIIDYLMKRGVNGLQLEFGEQVKGRGESEIHFELSERRLGK